MNQLNLRSDISQLRHRDPQTKPQQYISIKNKPLKMCVCVWLICGRGGFGLLCVITAYREGRRRECRGGRRERKPAERVQRGTDDRRHRLTHIQNPSRKMPNFEGSWKMKSSENFDDLLKALGEDHLLIFYESLNVYYILQWLNMSWIEVCCL